MRDALRGWQASPLFTTWQQDVYIWSQGDRLQHLRCNVLLFFVRLQYISTTLHPKICYICIMTKNDPLWNKQSLSLSNNPIDLHDSWFLRSFLLQVFVLLDVSLLALFPLSCLSPILGIKVCSFAFDLHSSRQTYLTWWKTVSGRHNHSLKEVMSADCWTMMNEHLWAESKFSSHMPKMAAWVTTVMEIRMNGGTNQLVEASKGRRGDGFCLLESNASVFFHSAVIKVEQEAQAAVDSSSWVRTSPSD